MGDPGADINVRSSSYSIGRVLSECPHCGVETPLIGLALPRQHQSLVIDWDVDEDDSVESRWECAGWSALLFYVEFLPERVARRLQADRCTYRFGFSEHTQSQYWANHCERCGVLLDDHDLYCEPDGAFLPIGESAAAAVTWERVDEAFEASAAGYSGDPQFLAAAIER